jgi:hypothetical protein
VQGFRVRTAFTPGEPAYPTSVPVLLEISSDTFAELSLAPLIDELMATPEVEHEGKTSRVVVKSEQLTVLLTVMRANARLHEHIIPAPVVVVPIRGNVSIDRDGHSLRVSTQADSVTLLGNAVEHEIVAHTDSAFLLIMGERDLSIPHGVGAAHADDVPQASRRTP